MSDPVVVGGARDVRASLDTPDTDTDACVVACPPHPRMGGHRGDRRLTAVSDALSPDIACLRFDYGAWDEGRGERTDAVRAVEWARERFASVALFGYSFGGAVALLAAVETDVAAVSALAPAARLDGSLDAAAALAAIACPVQVVYGERDTTAEWEPVVERAREHDCEVVAMGADHHFVGQGEKAAAHVAGFLRDHLG
ncbi:dienelactone hydrolase family protein [Halomarina ordinaria]|uniref:Dienelactone hydrolase family protein n=1 Tax=Halomarina ordinaria TaxID=3033939 RepID=A0ABD5U899_9EURY|nr:dienelactone hydrolase family protein [Halomarina sp. PSRA2]